MILKNNMLKTDGIAPANVLIYQQILYKESKRKLKIFFNATNDGNKNLSLAQFSILTHFTNDILGFLISAIMVSVSRDL